MYPDFKELLLAFNEHDVEYLIVGAHALAAHGHVRATKDLIFGCDLKSRTLKKYCERFQILSLRMRGPDRLETSVWRCARLAISSPAPDYKQEDRSALAGPCWCSIGVEQARVSTPLRTRLSKPQGKARLANPCRSAAEYIHSPLILRSFMSCPPAASVLRSRQSRRPHRRYSLVCGFANSQTQPRTDASRSSSFMSWP